MRARRPLSSEDVDFRWTTKVPAHLLPIVAWYEYARESKPLIERVMELRRAKLFCSSGRNKKIIQEHCTQHLLVIPLYRLRLLVCCKDFPKEPFRRAGGNAETKPMLNNKFFGTDSPVALPWTAYFGLKGIDMSEAYAKWHLRLGRSIVPISIPWQYTDAELTEMFRPIIKRIRPKEFPEPSRAGRRGGANSCGGLELLRQLVAYRLVEHEIEFDNPQWKSFHVYGSKRGFQDAAKAAAHRIDSIIRVPFFRRNNSPVHARPARGK